MIKESNDKKINVAICDDHQVVLEGLRLIFQQTPQINLMGVYNTPEALINFLNQTETPPQVILIDANLGEHKNGIDIPSKVNNPRRFRWVLFSAYIDEYLVFRAQKEGFFACLSKEVPSKMLIDVILDSTPGIKRFICFPPLYSDEKQYHKMEVVDSALKSLTKREHEIMAELLKGMSSKESANNLHISIYTFETHKKNIFRKLEINSTSEFMRIAIDFNLI